MPDKLTIIALSGSLRAGSFNTALARAAAALAPEDVTITVHDIADFPLYNGDLDTDEARPAPVARLKSAIADADGVLLATPEYNYGVSGVLKNAIDWASRPGYHSPFRHKPVAIVGASASAMGTVRAQGQLKQVLLGMLAEVFPYPEFALAAAHKKFDDKGALTDDQTRKLLAELLTEYAAWIRRRAA